jgi:oligopeptide transport system substrate-binding protein
LARHFTEGCNSKNAVKYLVLVGDSARTAFAYDEAIEAYVHALHFLTELEDHERAARTLMKLGLIYHNIFDFKSSREAYERGFAHQQLAAKRDISDSRTKEPAPHPFRGVFSQAPATLDPTHSMDAFSVWCINQLFSGLVQLTPEDELLPNIAQSWEMLDEGRKYIFHLRDDVVWSDGTPLTGADFEYSWKRTLSPENSQGLPEILFDINNAKEYREGLLDDPEALGINAIDDYTLEVDLAGPSNCFLQIMALAISKPVPQHIVQRYGDDWSDPETLVTNGPFRLKSLIDDKELIFERSDTYHGRFGGNISRVDLIRVPDEEAIAMYERDELDIIDPYSHLSIPDGTRMIQLHPDEYISMPAPSTFYFVFDATRPPFDDARVRRALVLAIDRPAVYNQMAQAIVFPATGGMVPTGIIGHVPGIALPYDPELARARLAEGGYPEGRELPPVEVVALDSSLSREYLECFAVQWKEILGLHITVVFRNYATYYEQIKKTRPCIWMTGWTADYPDPDSFLRCDPWLQQSGWRNERYETLVQEAKRITDQDSRMDLYRQAEQILVDEAPVVPIYYIREHVLINTWVIGLPASVIAGNILKDIVIESH